MTWFKVDDSFHSHPKVLAAEPAALGLWVVAGAWCSANLTDGFVPDYAIPRLLPGGVELAEQLVTCRLWRRAKGGFRFHDWASYNPSSDSVKTQRDSARDRMRKLREARRANQETAGQEEDCSGEHSANVLENFADSSQPRPDPTRSSSGTTPKKTSSSSDAKRGTRISSDFRVTPEMVSWASSECPLVDGRRETERFIDYWKGKSGKDATKVDWIATWKNWFRKEQVEAERHQQRMNARASPRDVPPSTAPKPIPRDEQCPDHPFSRKGACQACASLQEP